MFTYFRIHLEKSTDLHFHFLFHFQNILFSVGSAFLYYVNHFKLYSSFCASHSKAQKVLHPSKGAAPGRCLHYFFLHFIFLFSHSKFLCFIYVNVFHYDFFLYFIHHIPNLYILYSLSSILYAIFHKFSIYSCFYFIVYKSYCRSRIKCLYFVFNTLQIISKHPRLFFYTVQ